MITVDKNLGNRKDELLHYFRNRVAESLREIINRYGQNRYKKCAGALNTAIARTESDLVAVLEQRAKRDNWSDSEILNCMLMINYTKNVVMLESRNDIWPYEYMAFSRRIGEIWEPFCKLCFQYSDRVSLVTPPLFSTVKRELTQEIETYIDNLHITLEQKTRLKSYYHKVWQLVTAGEVKLELDLHFETTGQQINIDFKSGFGSNEKGNTNRLLLVATVYKIWDEASKCVLLVRSREDSNNNYFQILKNSGVWEAYCGDEAYSQIKGYTNFNIKQWIEYNVNWSQDFGVPAYDYFVENELEQYLDW